MTPSELTALEAVGVGIQAEFDAFEVYAELARRVPASFLQEKIKQLAKEELKHERILIQAYNQQFPQVPLALPPSQLPKQISCKSDRERLSVTEVLSCMIEQECKARKFYVDARQHATDQTRQTRQRMFNYLADWELSHELEVVAERDMVLRDSDYFEQTESPWKPGLQR